jgi:pimeloyl-ACP methyl ester carboxylesterase
MPGMAASSSIFENIKLPVGDFTIHYIDWIIPQKKESLTSYVSKLLKLVLHESPILIGVSFGGIIVQEMAKQIAIEKLILISTVKSNKEFPRRIRFSKTTGLHKIFPTSLIQSFELWSTYNFGISSNKIALYKKYLSVNNSIYLDWALDVIVNWKQEDSLPGSIHIHGDADPIFPIKYINDCIVVPGGTHIMIVNRYRWFNENLPEIISS